MYKRFFSSLSTVCRGYYVGVSSVRPHLASLSLLVWSSSLRHIRSRFVSPRCHSRGLFLLVFVGGQGHPLAHMVFSCSLGGISPLVMFERARGSARASPIAEGIALTGSEYPVAAARCRVAGAGASSAAAAGAVTAPTPSPSAACVCHPPDSTCIRGGVGGLACRGGADVSCCPSAFSVLRPVVCGVSAHEERFVAFLSELLLTFRAPYSGALHEGLDTFRRAKALLRVVHPDARYVHAVHVVLEGGDEDLECAVWAAELLICGPGRLLEYRYHFVDDSWPRPFPGQDGAVRDTANLLHQFEAVASAESGPDVEIYLEVDVVLGWD